ncbi:MAG: outer membrane protein [Sulfurimonas sp.]|jgi:outer membrane protein|uniref:TolC family protein n=1 Tax=Sulfurimonas sp. TaxID=2022749 RepID=UPI0039E46F46
MKNNTNVFLFLGLFGISLNAEVLFFSKAYELALENAHSIKASVYQVQGTKERIIQEESRLYPQINLSGYYKKSENSYYDAGRENLKQGLFNYGISVKQSVYNAEIYSRIDIETSKNKLYNIGLELEKEELAQTVFKAYLEVLKNNNKIKLYETYLKYSQSRLDELNKKYEMFMVSKMDLLEMQVEYKSAEIDLIKEKKILKVNMLRLKQLIGDTEYQLPTIESDKHLVDSINEMKVNVLNKNDFSMNLALLQSKLELKISNYEVKNASAGHYPKLDLEGSIYAYDTDNVDVQAPYKDTKSIMLVLNLPIYSGGSISSKVREKELTRQSVNEELLNTHKDIQVQYDEYIALFEASVASVSMYKDAYDSSLLYVDSVEQGYEHGLKSIIDLNDAKNKQYEVKYKYIENIYEMVDSYIGLLIVTNNFESIELLDKLVEQ